MGGALVGILSVLRGIPPELKLSSFLRLTKEVRR